MSAKHDNLRKMVHDMRFTLSQRFPNCFQVRGAIKKPLAIGVHRDVFTRAPDLDPKLVKMAINDYVRGPKYQTQLLENAPRLDLDGNVSSLVTLDHARWAVMKMRGLRKQWAEKDKRRRANRRQAQSKPVEQSQAAA